MRLWFLFALVFGSTAMAASEGQTWVQFVTQGKLNDRLRLFAEFQPRYGFTTPGVTTIILRPAVGWQFSDTFTAWAGYGWTPVINPSYRDEQRGFLQFSLTHPTQGLTLTQRTRLETRFLSSASGPSFRFRHAVRLVVPLSTDSPWSLAFSDEVFFALNDVATVSKAGFDQNRLFVGLNYKLSSPLAVDVGYLWNAINRLSPLENKTNHVLMLTLYHNFSLI